MNSKTKGILYVITAAFGFSMMSVFVHLAGDLPVFQKAFFRNIVALIFVTGIMLKRKIGVLPEKKNLLIKPWIMVNLLKKLRILRIAWTGTDFEWVNKLWGYLYKFMVFARMLGRPHGVAPTNIRFIHNLFINSKPGLIIPPYLTVLPYRCIIK